MVAKSSHKTVLQEKKIEEKILVENGCKIITSKTGLEEIKF